MFKKKIVQKLGRIQYYSWHQKKNSGTGKSPFQSDQLWHKHATFCNSVKSFSSSQWLAGENRLAAGTIMGTANINDFTELKR